MFSGWTWAHAQDQRVWDPCSVTSRHCCPSPGSSVAGLDNGPREAFALPHPAAPGSSSWTSYLSCLWHNTNPRLQGEAGGTFLQVPWQEPCSQWVWPSPACGWASRHPHHCLKKSCYSCRCSWATAWKASVQPYGALGMEPPLWDTFGM